jgi:hypothetical protein
VSIFKALKRYAGCVDDEYKAAMTVGIGYLPMFFYKLYLENYFRYVDTESLIDYMSYIKYQPLRNRIYDELRLRPFIDATGKKSIILTEAVSIAIFIECLGNYAKITCKKHAENIFGIIK